MISDSVYSVIQIASSVLLVLLILIQVKGSGFGTELGSQFGFYSTRRGVEKMVFYLTVVTASLFLIFSTLRIVL